MIAIVYVHFGRGYDVTGRYGRPVPIEIAYSNLLHKFPIEIPLDQQAPQLERGIVPHFGGGRNAKIIIIFKTITYFFQTIIFYYIYPFILNLC